MTSKTKSQTNGQGNGTNGPAQLEQPANAVKTTTKPAAQVQGEVVQVKGSIVGQVNGGETVSLTESVAGHINVGQNATLTNSTVGFVRTGTNMELRDGGATIVVAGGDFSLLNGGAGVLVAGRDLTLTNGGGGFLTAGRDLTVTNGSGGVQSTAQTLRMENGASFLAAGRTVEIKQGSAVGLVLSGQTTIAPGAQVTVSITPHGLAGAVVGLAFFLPVQIWRRLTTH